MGQIHQVAYANQWIFLDFSQQITAIDSDPGVADIRCRLDALQSQRVEGILADRDRTIARVRADYAHNASLSRQVYCAATPEDALKLMGIQNA